MNKFPSGAQINSQNVFFFNCFMPTSQKRSKQKLFEIFALEDREIPNKRIENNIFFSSIYKDTKVS